MNYEDLEDEIVEKLDPLVADYSCVVIPHPDAPADYPQTFAKPVVMVTVAQGAWDKTRSISVPVQDNRIGIEVLINCRHRRSRNGNIGMLDVAEMVQSLLLGFKPSNCDQLFLKSMEFVKLDQAHVWSYAVNFEAMGMRIKTYEPPVQPEAILTKLSLDNAGANEVPAVEVESPEPEPTPPTP